MRIVFVFTIIFSCVLGLIAQDDPFQIVDFEVGCMVGVFSDGENLYAALDDNRIQVYEDGTWSEAIELLNSSSSIGGITVDDNGVVWYASDDGLFSYTNLEIDRFTTSNSDLSTNVLRNVYSVDSILYLITNGKDVIKKNGSNFETITVLDGQFDRIENSILTDSGEIIVTYSNKVVILNDTSITQQSLGGRAVNDLFLDADGNVLIGTTAGMMKYSSGTLEIEAISGLFDFENLKLVGEDHINGFYGVTQDFRVLYRDSSGVSFEIDQFDYDEPNFEKLFIHNNLMRSYGLNVNGTVDSCYVITTLCGILVDVDEDGFTNDIDCDDEDENINPDAEDIPDNGIDENCDGDDLITSSTSNYTEIDFIISPNPVRDILIFSSIENEFTAHIYNIQGELKGEIILGGVSNQINMSNFKKGLYIVHVFKEDSYLLTKKIIKM